MALKDTRTGPLDWAKVLTDEARVTGVILASELASKYKLPVASAQRALSRLSARGLVSRVAEGVYANKLVRDLAAADFIKVLRPNSYVSLESALSHWGLSTQCPVALTCVTTGKPKEYRVQEFAIRFRTISRNLYWGFVEKQSRYSTYLIAEPEKALLDWVYLSLQRGIRPSLDEIEIKSVSKQKLAEYASKFPGSVRNVVANSLAFEHFVV